MKSLRTWLFGATPTVYLTIPVVVTLDQLTRTSQLIKCGLDTIIKELYNWLLKANKSLVVPNVTEKKQQAERVDDSLVQNFTMNF